LFSGQPVRGFVAGKVLASSLDDWSPGDLFGASLPFSTYQTLTKEQIDQTVMWKLTGLISVEEISLGRIYARNEMNRTHE